MVLDGAHGSSVPARHRALLRHIALLQSPNFVFSNRGFIEVFQRSFLTGQKIPVEHDHTHELPELKTGSHGHPVCSECGRTIWNDPKLAGAAIVPLDNGIVMVQRAIEPAIGKWSFPSGYVNRGERVEHAVEREVLEECGLETVAERLVGLYSADGNDIVLAVYEVRVTGGRLHAGDHETLDVQVVDVENLPELAFDHDRGIIADWIALSAR